jgi:hypothetical protein
MPRHVPWTFNTLHNYAPLSRSCYVQGSILSGRLRWSFNIVRNCEMFWFGVTANINRDPASFIAVDPATWMVSDEAFCLEHCRRARSGARCFFVLNLAGCAGNSL